MQAVLADELSAAGWKVEREAWVRTVYGKTRRADIWATRILPQWRRDGDGWKRRRLTVAFEVKHAEYVGQGPLMEAVQQVRDYMSGFAWTSSCGVPLPAPDVACITMTSWLSQVPRDLTSAQVRAEEARRREAHEPVDLSSDAIAAHARHICTFGASTMSRTSSGDLALTIPALLVRSHGTPATQFLVRRITDYRGYWND